MRRHSNSLRLLTTILKPKPHHHHPTTNFCTNPSPPQNPNPNRFPRTRTPSEKHFETWITHLRPGFTDADVNQSLLSQSDPDLALDIFRWTAQQRNYTHTHTTYLTILQIALHSKRFTHAETLIEEIYSGACTPHPVLYNLIIKYCCSKNTLFNRAFDVYTKMLKTVDCKPSLETYTVLLNAVLRKFGKVNVCYVYLHAVRSLHKQMKANGVVPDTFVLNLIIKAYAMCLDMDGALRVFREMGLYGCEQNEFSYSYVAKGLCEKGKVDQGFGFFKEMREKGFVATSSTYMILICSLAMERRFEDGIKVMFDMLDVGRVPDLLTYKTILEEMCRDGRGDDAFALLEELRLRKGAMGDRIYNTLLDGLHFLSRE